MGAAPNLVYIYGPPAVGKLTVATELHNQTGIRLFHNHLTVDAIRAVFDFASPPFEAVVHRLRIDVFETAARNGVDLIFTNNSLWGIPNGRALFVSFADEAQRRVEMAGGRVAFVQLTAPAHVLNKRIGLPSRQKRRKLTDPHRLRELLEDLSTAALHPDDLVLDTSMHDPRSAAATIAHHFGIAAVG